MVKKSLFLSLLLVVMVGVTGCITIKKQAVETSNLGGVFLSADRIETWATRSQLMTPGELPGSIGKKVDCITLIMVALVGSLSQA